ncbi:MAG: GDP-L-fucose synthase family protein [Nitrososphaera sp.]
MTGGRGFLGSYVVQLLKLRGARKVIAPSSKEYDLTDLSNCRRIVQDIDIIFHLAAKVGGIGLNLERPAELFYDNLIMGTQLMNEARKCDVEKFIALGTICSYPKFTPVPFSEDHIWEGYPEETNAPYGLAKKMLLVQSQAYWQQYKFRSIVVFPTNLYGPRDNFDPSSSHVIPALILKIYNAMRTNSEEVTVWGDGSPTRDFLYVEDAAKGIVLAAEHYDSPSPLNLGSGQEVSIKDLVTVIARLLNYSGGIVWDVTKPNGQPRRCVSNERAEKELGFRPSVSLENGLSETIRWFKSEHQNNSKLLVSSSDG